MVKVGRVALDGTKLQANASRHKAMSYPRLVAKEDKVEAEIAELEAMVAGLLADAEAIDAAEDARYGVDGKDADLPAELDRRERARQQAEDKERRRQNRSGDTDEQKVTDAGQAATDTARPKPKAQANFTDPDSRIMRNSEGAYVQAYKRPGRGGRRPPDHHRRRRHHLRYAGYCSDATDPVHGSRLRRWLPLRQSRSARWRRGWGCREESLSSLRVRRGRRWALRPQAIRGPGRSNTGWRMSGRTVAALEAVAGALRWR